MAGRYRAKDRDFDLAIAPRRENASHSSRTAQLNAPADKALSVAFDNQEGAPHNVAIYKISRRRRRSSSRIPSAGFFMP